MTKKSSRITGLFIGNTRISVYFNAKNRYSKYEILHENRKVIIARTDTEEKARMFVDAYEIGYMDGSDEEYKKNNIS